VDHWLLPIADDPDYYCPDEVALVAGKDLPESRRAANTKLLRRKALPFFSAAHSGHDGYINAILKRGNRIIDVRQSGNLEAVRMCFSVLLPTEGFEYVKSALHRLYARVNELPDLTALQLHERLRGLPCCTTTSSGTGEVFR